MTSVVDSQLTSWSWLVAPLSRRSDAYGAVNVALTVVPDMQEPTSGEADDQFDQEVTGGCSTGGGSSGALFGLALLAAVVRRRR